MKSIGDADRPDEVSIVRILRVFRRRMSQTFALQSDRGCIMSSRNGVASEPRFLRLMLVAAPLWRSETERPPSGTTLTRRQADTCSTREAAPAQGCAQGFVGLLALHCQVGALRVKLCTTPPGVEVQLTIANLRELPNAGLAQNDLRHMKQIRDQAHGVRHGHHECRARVRPRRDSVTGTPVEGGSAPGTA